MTCSHSSFAAGGRFIGKKWCMAWVRLFFPTITTWNYIKQEFIFFLQLKLAKFREEDALSLYLSTKCNIMSVCIKMALVAVVLVLNKSVGYTLSSRLSLLVHTTVGMMLVVADGWSLRGVFRVSLLLSLLIILYNKKMILTLVLSLPCSSTS